MTIFLRKSQKLPALFFVARFRKFVGEKTLIGSNFWKCYLIRTDFTLSESVSLVKMFRMFKFECIFFGVQSVDMVGRCTSYTLVGAACL
jgi:hypothetical protein